MARLPIEISALLGPFVDDLRATLGPELHGVYVYGSAVAGDFHPQASDFDVVVLTTRPAEEIGLAPFAGLVERLAAREAGWRERLDVVFISRDTLARFRSGGSLYSISHDEPLQRYDDANDWLQTWYLLRERSVAVVGPPAAEVLPPITVAEFKEAVTRNVLGLAARAPTEAETMSDGRLPYVLLTLCRVLYTVETGEVVSKDAAAAWLGRRRPDLVAPLARVQEVRRSAAHADGFDAAERATIQALIGRLAADVERARATLGLAVPGVPAVPAVPAVPPD